MNEDSVLQQTRERQMEALRSATQMTEPAMQRQNVLEQQDLEVYDQLSQRSELRGYQSQNLAQIKDKLVNHLLVLNDTDIQNLQALPEELVRERQRQLDETKKAANISGMEKIKNDFLGKKKRAAKNKLNDLKQLHATVEALNTQQESAEIDRLHKEAKQSISRGRRWANPLRAAMNHFSLGSHAARHKDVEFPQLEATINMKVEKLGAESDPPAEPEFEIVPTTVVVESKPVEIKTGEGTLCGSLYSPNSAIRTQAGREKITTGIKELEDYQKTNNQKEQEYRSQLNTLLERREALTDEDPQLEADISKLERNIQQTETRKESYVKRIAQRNKELETFDEMMTSMRNQQKGKLVIFFSGSGGPAASMVKGVAQTYVAAGASVLSMDYRGFGESISEKVRKSKDGEETRSTTGTHLCEASIYKDGREMYNYAVNELGYKPSDIILHGFSMGGAVASKIAADIAQENSASDQPVEEEKKLGGVVLHSAMDSMYGASSRLMGMKMAGTLGWMGSGGYNTASHMRRLHKFDPDLPVHYRGGGEKDQLSLELTSLHKDPQAAFKNTSTYYGDKGHQNDEDDEAENVTEGTGGMVELVKKGRAADLRGTDSQD